MRLNANDSIAFSSILHGLLLWALVKSSLIHKKVKSSDAKEDSKLEITFKEKPNFRPKGMLDIEILENLKIVEDKLLFKPEAQLRSDILIESDLKQDMDGCPGKWYGGLGIDVHYESYGCTVVKVYKGYGADKAGLLVGDFIKSIDDAEIMGKPGTFLRMQILRGEEELIVTAVRSKVCY